MVSAESTCYFPHRMMPPPYSPINESPEAADVPSTSTAAPTTDMTTPNLQCNPPRSYQRYYDGQSLAGLSRISERSKESSSSSSCSSAVRGSGGAGAKLLTNSTTTPSSWQPQQRGDVIKYDDHHIIRPQFNDDCTNVMMNRSALFGASTKPHAGDETQILKNESSCWGTTCFDTTNQQNMISPPTHMATTGMTVVNDPWDEVTHQKLIDANGDYTQNLALFINSSGPKIKKGLHAQLGRHLYVIQHKIASGGFAHIHLAQRDDGKKIVIKEENGGSLWEAHMLNVTRRRFNKNEKLSSYLSILPQIHACVNYVDKTLTLIDYYPNGSLLDWMNSCRLEALSIDKRVVALDMMKMINSLHQIAVIHGDVKPDNFMVVGQYNTSRGDRVPVMKLIDFGRAIDMNAYQKNTVFIARSKTSCYECPQMIEGLPWNIHIDLFAIAASIYPLAFSSFLKPIKHEESGKWGVPQLRLGEIWEVFYDELLNFTTPTNNFVPSFRDSPLPKLIELFQGAKH